MTPSGAPANYVGLIAIKLSGTEASVAEARAIVSAALEPFAAEPLEWEPPGQSLARLTRADSDFTTTNRVLAIEMTLGAAVAIRKALRGCDVAVALACDIEASTDGPAMAAYWVRRQRLDALVREAANETVCRRDLGEARASTLAQLHIHLEPQETGRDLRLVEGPATTLTANVGRWLTAYVEPLPPSWVAGGFLDARLVHDRRDVAEVASPSPSTRVVLIVADAWVGKSYVAGRLYEELVRSDIEVHQTSMESAARGSWPSDKFLQRSDPRVWILDAADEAERRGESLGKLKSFDRPGLTTIVLGRPDASLADVERFLGFSNPLTRSAVEREKLRLLPLDRDQARREIVANDESRFERLAQVAAQFTSALTFAELAEIDRLLSSAQSIPSLHQLREGIAKHRCTRARKGAGPLRSAADMLSAAKRIAAIAALTNERLFTFGELGPGFLVNAVVPGELIDAAYALQHTTALTRVGASWSFAAAHLEEDLAAAFLVDAIKQRAPMTVHGLRTLLTDGQSPRSGLQRVIARVREALAESERDMLEDALRAFESGEALRCFQAMIAIAREAKRLHWMSQVRLTSLDLDSVRTDAKQYFTGDAPPAVRYLVLQLALANDWNGLAAAATKIALSGDEDAEVRELAVRLAAKDPPQLGLLTVLLDRIPKDCLEALARVRAEVVLQLLRHGHLTPLEAARRSSPGQDRLVDIRAMAVEEIARRIDGEAARAILDEIADRVPKTIDVWVLNDLSKAAVTVFLGSSLDAGGADIDRLLHLLETPEAFEFGVVEANQAVAADEHVRRAVYRRLDVEKGKPSYVLDVAKDAAWLIERASELTTLTQNVAGDLFVSALTLESRGLLADAERAREMLRRLGWWDTFAAKQQSASIWEERQREWAAAREAKFEETRKHALPIERALDTFRGDRRDASIRLHVLGDFFFGERHNGRNIVGTFEDDLEVVHQAEIIRLTRSALNEASPLPVPEGWDSFSSHVLYEGQAFSASALWDDDWLDANEVARWLPTALFAAAGNSKSRSEDLLDRGFSVAPAQTRAAVLGDIARCARRGHSQLHRIPRVLWDDGAFRTELIALALRLSTGGEHERAALSGVLEALLGAYDESSAPPAVRAMLQSLLDGTDRAIANAAISAWFSRWPEEGVDQAIERSPTISNALVVFAPYFEWRHHRRVLPPSVEARIATHLIPLVPVTAPMHRQSGIISSADSIAEWRDSLVCSCINRWVDVGEPTSELREAIETLRGTPPYNDWLSGYESGRRMDAALAFRPRPWPDAEQVASILRGVLALIRDVSDLAALVAEIANEPWDPALTPLLFANGGRREESYLQALLLEKLRVGLSRAQPRVEARLIREPSERRTDEPDFVVFAGPMEVPIEVKWSDNKPVAGLEEQLGERYLGNAGRTHGVYVVGWIGKPTTTHLDATLDEARRRQAALGRTIHVVRKNLLPPATAKVARLPKSGVGVSKKR